MQYGSQYTAGGGEPKVEVVWEWRPWKWKNFFGPGNTLYLTEKQIDAYKGNISTAGEVDVAYGRIMLIGPGGVGKTSLLRGLQHKLHDEKRSSTIVAQVHHLKPCYPSANWSEVSDEDELEELAQLMAASIEMTATQAIVGLLPKLIKNNMNEFEELVDSSIVDAAVKRAMLIEDGYYKRNLKCLPYYHVWDCGGQPVFLDILPAFLTPRTLFLTLFDASKDLNGRSESKEFVNGQLVRQEKLSTTQLELMHGWMSSIYSYHLKKDEGNVPLKYPRILPIGTKGDELEKKGKRKDEVLKELGQSFDGKAFSCILQEPVIINNATSGTRSEDPGYHQIRENIFNFTTKGLKVRTSIPWVLFHRFVRIVASKKKKTTISMHDAIVIAKACKLTEDEVPKLLEFYHNLGVILYYPRIKGLEDTIILDPMWFVQCLGKILALEGQEEAKYEMRSEWKLLREKGILVQRLYETVWRKYEGITPSSIMELLVSLQLAAKIDISKVDGMRYIVLTVLPYSSGLSAELRDIKLRLHITFEEGYVVPGYFIRLAAVMQSSKNCSLVLDDNQIFRDQLSFKLEKTHTMFVTLMQTSEVIICYLSKATSLINKDYQDLMAFLRESCEKVEKGLNDGHAKEQWDDDRIKVVDNHSDGEVTCEFHPFDFRVVRSIHVCIDNPITPKAVFDYLKNISTDWYEIGGALGVSYNDLQDTLKLGHMQSKEMKLDSVINKWIESQCSEVSWDTLREALTDIKHKTVADKLPFN